MAERNLRIDLTLNLVQQQRQINMAIADFARLDAAVAKSAVSANRAFLGAVSGAGGGPRAGPLAAAACWVSMRLCRRAGAEGHDPVPPSGTWTPICGRWTATSGGPSAWAARWTRGGRGKVLRGDLRRLRQQHPEDGRRVRRHGGRQLILARLIPEPRRRL